MAFRAIVTAGDNPRLNYPVAGRIQILEVFTDGAVLCSFQAGFYEGGEFNPDGAPVVLRRPEFTHC